MLFNSTSILQASVRTTLTCRSNDPDASQCVDFSATANALATATARVHAEAVANAVSNCSCMSKAVTDALAPANLFIRIVADAAVTAAVSVCIDGTLSR
jgi:hypothetical protein